MTRLFLALLLLVLGAAPASGEPADVRVTVTSEAGRWTAEYDFGRAAPAWLFTRSALAAEDRTPWRPEAWTVETPGVRLERRGAHDVLVGEAGSVPRRVRIAFTPFARRLEADYDPALVFSDGTAALFTGHFEVAPLPSAAAAEALPADLNGVDLEAVALAGAFRGEVPVRLGAQAGAEVRWDGSPAYVLYGAGELVEAEAFRSLVDPGLPAWVGAELGAFTPRLLALYAERLGPPAGARPTVLVSWVGPTPSLRSMGGSVLPGTVVMRFEGEGLMAPDAETLGSARWFLAHEGAHFWLRETVRYARARDAWITEGGADLLAARATALLDPDFDAHAFLQQAVDDCVRLAGRPVAEAGARGEHRASYACGATLALAAEARWGGPAAGGAFGFHRDLIAARREAGEVGADDWLGLLEARSGDAELVAAARRLVEAGDADPAGLIAGLLTRAGVPHRRGADGAVILDRAP